MKATMDQLLKAHARMLGRIEAANIEQRRAWRANDPARSRRAGRDAIRRQRAGLRLLDAMRGAR